MGNVILLDEDTANRIAAGEVVERPSSVVKELIENSLDAGAAKITVEIKKGGIASISVSDDGEGFHDDDVLLAFERFATSKLRSVEELWNVSTLGFRGEALPSIASVSKVRLMTRRRGAEYGRLVEIHAGKLIKNEAVGCPYGTTINVSELFYNLPARYKFLKKDSAEAANISELVGKLAIGRPDVSFSLMTQNAQLLHTQGSGKTEDAVFAVYGKDLLAGLMPINNCQPIINQKLINNRQTIINQQPIVNCQPIINQKLINDQQPIRLMQAENMRYIVSGYIGRPATARANRNLQLFFVNGRLIKNRIIGAAVEAAYKSHMPSRRFPVALLNITMDAALVDVNAHPAKTEVRFQSESDLFRAVYFAVEATLRSEASAPSGYQSNDMPASAGAYHTGGEESAPGGYQRYDAPPPQLPLQLPPLQPPTNGDHYARPPQREIAEFTHATPATAVPDVTAVDADNPETTAPGAAAPVREQTGGQLAFHAYTGAAEDGRLYVMENEATEINTAIFGTAKYLGQLFGTYLALEWNDTLTLVDQHAAHERMLYEIIKTQYEKNAISRQLLLESVIVNLLPDEMHFIREVEPFLKKAGFVFEEFGREAIVLREAPLYMERTDIREFFYETLEIVRLNLRIGKTPEDAAVTYDKVLYSIACKAAVKGNRQLSPNEATELLRALDNLPKPLTCPHGRPLVVTMPKKEFDKKFRRI